MKNIPFLAIPQEFFLDEEFTEKRVYSAAEAILDLVLMSKKKDCTQLVNGHSVKLQAGELVASLRYLGNRWQWSKDKVARFINARISRHVIRQETRQGETVLSIDLFGYYEKQTYFDETAFETQTETETRQKKDKRETKYKMYRCIDNKNISSISPLLKVVKILKPSAELPRPKKEMTAWQKMSVKPTDEQIDLIRWFYSQPKSADYNETWRRKQDVPALLNNWQDMVELAEQLKSKSFRDGNAEVGQKNKSTPPLSSDSPDFWMS